MQAVKKTSAIALLAVASLMPGFLRALEVGRVSTSSSDNLTMVKVLTKGVAKVKVIGEGRTATIFVAGGQRELKPISLAKGLVKTIAFSKAEGGLNILLGLRQAAGASLGKAGAAGFEVVLSPVASAAAEETSDLSPKIAGYTYRVVDLALQGDATRSELVISADGPANYKHSVRDGNKTLRLVFQNSALAWTGDSTRFMDEAVEGVDVKQLNSEGEASVRVDIRLRAKLDYSFQRDQNQLVVRLVKPLAEKASPKRGNLDSLVTLDVQNADLVGVIKVLCEQAGFEYQLTRDILAKTGTEAQVTLKVEEKPFRQVMASILGGVTGRFIRQGNTLFIGSDADVSNRMGRLPTITRSYQPRFYSGKELKALIAQQFVFDDSAKERFAKGASDDPRDSSRVLLVGTQDEIKEWMDLLVRYDAPEGGVSGGTENMEGGVETRLFKMEYLEEASMSLIDAAISNQWPDNPPKHSYDKYTRHYIVTGNGYILDKVAKIIRKLDVRPSQVNIEAKILETNEDNSLNFGINWTGTKVGGNPSASAISRSMPLAGPSVFGSVNLGYLTNGIQLSSVISTAVSQKKADVISSPNITVKDLEAAEININDTISYSSTETSYPNGVAVYAEKIQTQTFPLSLKVTPFIAKLENKIMLTIAFEMTTQSGPATGGGLAPTSISSAKTRMTVSNGETAVIGGLIKNNTSNLENKVPVLGDIPLLGMLFKYKEQSKNKKEVIIFITPTRVEN